MSAPIVGRFAPSPSGFLHLGNLMSMLLAWLDARSLGGQVILRMEDLDPVRTNAKYALAIAEDLQWLGLYWDSGWPDPACAQSNRTPLYEDAFQLLQRKGLVYPCYCSRVQRLAASAPHPGEDVHERSCRCLHLTARERVAIEASGRRPAWKVRVPDEVVAVADGHYGPFAQNLARDVGDFIIRRADGVFGYQLAVTVDDMLMGVTRVVRGHDLLDSAPRQAWLIRTMGGEAPTYCHGPLLIGENGKLSKRLGSVSTMSLRQSSTPEAVLGRLAYLAGLLPAPEPIEAQSLISLFDWAAVPKKDIPI